MAVCDVPLSQAPQQVRSDPALPQVQGVHGLQVLQQLLVYQAHPAMGIHQQNVRHLY